LKFPFFNVMKRSELDSMCVWVGYLRSWSDFVCLRASDSNCWLHEYVDEFKQHKWATLE
jgi:hypothetical protein